MSRLASPAIGCHLHLVEVQVGDDVETYNATTFEQPLEFSLQGQPSLVSELGSLLLIISTGSKQMLSLRLNDLLNHAHGTDQTIAIDKQTYKICVRLPNLDHTLRVWFRHSRDFLVSVCILRKTGFRIEEEVSPGLTKTAAKTNKNLVPNETTSPVDSPHLSTITTLAALTKQAGISQAQYPNSSEVVITPNGNIFDEVIERLKQTGNKNAAASSKGSGMPGQHGESDDMSLLKPYNVFSGKRKSITNISTVYSPLQGSSSYEHLKCRVTSKMLEKTKQNVAADPLPHRRHHGYFTRSFSLTARRLGTDVNEEEHSCPAKGRGDGRPSGPSDCLRSPSDKVNSSFNSSPAVDFRNLMPHRRSLPFLRTIQQRHKRLRMKMNRNGESDAPKTPVNVSTRMEIQDLNAQPVHGVSELLMLLMRASTLDELEMKSSFLYKQYEQDVADGYQDEKRAAFYLDSLENVRRSFWLDKLQNVSETGPETWAEGC